MGAGCSFAITSDTPTICLGGCAVRAVKLSLRVVGADMREFSRHAVTTGVHSNFRCENASVLSKISLITLKGPKHGIVTRL